MMVRYHYSISGVEAGPLESSMQIKPEWKGSPSPKAPLEIFSARACDRNPNDPTDDETAQRLEGNI